jgi:solute carrier family 25 2-oxodicarboxylate transporter 21
VNSGVIGFYLFSGFVEVCIMHPLDLVKTRFQIQSKKINVPGDPNYYTGIADCMKKMYQNEGFFAFWKGVLPPILVETPKRAVKVSEHVLFKMQFNVFSHS